MDSRIKHANSCRVATCVITGSKQWHTHPSTSQSPSGVPTPSKDILHGALWGSWSCSMCVCVCPCVRAQQDCCQNRKSAMGCKRWGICNKGGEKWLIWEAGLKWVGATLMRGQHGRYWRVKHKQSCNYSEEYNMFTCVHTFFCPQKRTSGMGLVKEWVWSVTRLEKSASALLPPFSLLTR